MSYAADNPLRLATMAATCAFTLISLPPNMLFMSETNWDSLLNRGAIEDYANLYDFDVHHAATLTLGQGFDTHLYVPTAR